MGRLTRLIRLIRLVALATKVKRGWDKINLKVYAAFFLVVGVGFTASFIATGFEHSSVDITWISLFVSIFGVFYAVLISFFVIHVWGKFNSISAEMSKEVNSLRNVYLLSLQLPDKTIKTRLSQVLASYIDEIIKNLWENTLKYQSINKKFLDLVYFFNDTEMKIKADNIVFDNIIQELRSVSVSQSNLINLARDKTPKILWILLILLSTVLVASFIFLGFKNQILATALISLISIVTGLVVALIFDIDTPFRAGFWNVPPDLYIEVKEFVKSNSEGKNQI